MDAVNEGGGCAGRPARWGSGDFNFPTTPSTGSGFGVTPMFEPWAGTKPQEVRRWVANLWWPAVSTTYWHMLGVFVPRRDRGRCMRAVWERQHRAHLRWKDAKIRETTIEVKGFGSRQLPPPPPLKVGDSVYVLMGAWKIRRSIVTEVTGWDSGDPSDITFNSRPATSEDVPPDRRFIRAMRIGRAKRVVRGRINRMIGRGDG